MPAASLASRPSATDLALLRRATYYLRRDQIRSLRLVAASLERNISEVVRAALDEYLAACAVELEAQAQFLTDHAVIAVPGHLAAIPGCGSDPRQLSMFPEERP